VVAVNETMAHRTVPGAVRVSAARARRAGRTAPRSRHRRVRTCTPRTSGEVVRSRPPAAGSARRLRARTPASRPPASRGWRAS